MLERVNDHENLGALFRNAAAFGIDAVLLCPECSDPLYRRSVRVSTGHVLTVPWTRATPWPDAIDGSLAHGFTVLALTPNPAAERIDAVSPIPGDRVAIMLGCRGPGPVVGRPEAGHPTGSGSRWPPGVDSVNVAVAGAVAFARFAAPGRLS